jgi:hypothetical protein
MWNMSKRGFEGLPGPRSDFEEVWRLTGGNPEMLARLYEAEWDVGAVVEGLVKAKKLKDLARGWSRELREVVEDPDSLSREDFPEEQGGVNSQQPHSLRHVPKRGQVLDRRTAARETWSSG